MTTPDFFEQIADAVAKRLKADAPAQPTHKRLLPISEAAEYLGCSTAHVRKLVLLKVLPVVTWPSENEQRDKWWFDIEDLDKAIRENKHNAA